MSIAVQPLGRFTVKVRTDEPATVRLEEIDGAAAGRHGGERRPREVDLLPLRARSQHRDEEVVDVNAFGFGRLATRSA